jgi:DNA repair protein RecO (recombination protein O)
MLLKTRGIVLRAVKYSETSLIIDVFTEEKGLRNYIVSGVRASRAKVSAGLLQVMSWIDLVAYESKETQGKLQRIKEVKAAYVYQTLPFEIQKSSIGLFMAEILRRTLRESEENKPLFDFIFTTFTHLDASAKGFSNLHLSFALGLSGYLGFMPQASEGDHFSETTVFDLREGVFIEDGAVGHTQFLNPRISSLLNQLLKKSPEESHEVVMTREERQILLDGLINFYHSQIENMPEINAHRILREIF